MRRVVWVAVAAGLGSACVPSPAASPFPERLTAAIGTDSAISVIARSLREERLPVDGDVVAPGTRVLTSTFTVRPGGLGESTIRLRFRVNEDGDRVIVAFDAEAQERRRLIEVGVEDPREPRRLVGPHVINPNDREVIGRVRALLRRLAGYGIRADGS
jgi:hypothetical protein